MESVVVVNTNIKADWNGTPLYSQDFEEETEEDENSPYSN